MKKVFFYCFVLLLLLLLLLLDLAAATNFSVAKARHLFGAVSITYVKSDLHSSPLEFSSSSSIRSFH